MEESSSTAWLDSLVQAAAAGGSVYRSFQDKPAAPATVKPVAVSQPTNWSKIALIGGGVLAAVLVLVLVLRK